MDLRWLDATAPEVAEAMAAQRRGSRPAWVPTRRQVLLHVNNTLVLWYLCIVLMTFGVRVDSYHGGQATASDISGLLIAAAVLAVWLVATFAIYKWAKRPPAPRARLQQWRQELTALANGFEPQPSPRVTFTSMISPAGRPARAYPRFVAAGVEFGNLTSSGARPGARSTDWHYLAVTLPAVLPHIVLDATANNRIVSDLPAGVDRSQRLALEGGFDRWFHVYAPEKYHTDALYVLSPDVMAALVDGAAGFNVEIVDRFLVFFGSSATDFSRPGPWQSVHALLGTVVPRISAKSTRYWDERVPGQEVPRVIQAIDAAIENPGVPGVAPTPRIGPDGHRLVLRRSDSGVWWVLGAVGWFVSRTLLYVVPGIFAFAGLMSIIDGR